MFTCHKWRTSLHILGRDNAHCSQLLSKGLALWPLQGLVSHAMLHFQHATGPNADKLFATAKPVAAPGGQCTQEHRLRIPWGQLRPANQLNAFLRSLFIPFENSQYGREPVHSAHVHFRVKHKKVATLKLGRCNGVRTRACDSTCDIGR